MEIEKSMTPDPSSKTKILEKATELFMRNSYNKISVAEIAENIPEIEKSTIFYHFKSKLNLANQVIEYAIHQFELAQSSIFTKIKSPRQRLELVIDGMIEMTKEFPKLMNFLIEIFEENQKHHTKIDGWVDLSVDYISMLSQILKECKVKNPEGRALIMLSALDGFIMYRSLLPDISNTKAAFFEDAFQGFKDELIRMVLSQ
jgi:AcrR family transcriptional regulator